MPAECSEDEPRWSWPAGRSLARRPSYAAPSPPDRRLPAGDDPDAANVVYVTLLDTGADKEHGDEVIELVTNLDDMSPEHIAFLLETVMEAGALDAWQTPATFKKGRLGCVLSVLVEPPLQKAITELIFRHSTTIGIRWRRWERSILDRKTHEETTPLGTVRVKSVLLDGKVLRSKPEYDDLCRIARENNIPITDVENLLNQENV